MRKLYCEMMIRDWVVFFIFVEESIDCRCSMLNTNAVMMKDQPYDCRELWWNTLAKGSLTRI